MEQTQSNINDDSNAIDLGPRFWIVFLAILGLVIVFMLYLWGYNSNRQYNKYITAVQAIESSSHTQELKDKVVSYYELNKQLEDLTTTNNSNLGVIDASRINDDINILSGQIDVTEIEIEALKDRITQEAKDQDSDVNYASLIIFDGENYCLLNTSGYYSSTSSDDRCLIGTAEARLGYPAQDAIKALYNKAGLKDKELFKLINQDNEYDISGIADIDELDIDDSTEIEKLYISFSIRRG